MTPDAFCQACPQLQGITHVLMSDAAGGRMPALPDAALSLVTGL